MANRDLIARLLRVVVMLLLVGVGLPRVHEAFVGVSVTVDGETISVARGTDVAGVLIGCPSARPGRLLAASTHRVVGESAGGPCTVLVNGKHVPLTLVLHTGDRVEAKRGADLVEPVVEETRTVDPSARTIGAGSVRKVLSAGTPTVVVLKVGSVSGEIVATETVSVGVPAVVRMVPEPGANVVALTFDDGPWPGQTEQILSILEQRNVPATFFMLGMRVERAPELARAVASAGHAVGNHTYWHVDLSAVRADVAEWEIEATNQMILQAAGVRPVWLRAPGGLLGGPAHAYISQRGMSSVLWTVDPQDWREGATPEVLAWSVISAAHPGAIIVLHDGGGDQTTTIAALPMIIDGLRYYGYEFVTLDELPEVRAGW